MARAPVLSLPSTETEARENDKVPAAQSRVPLMRKSLKSVPEEPPMPNHRASCRTRPAYTSAWPCSLTSVPVVTRPSMVASRAGALSEILIGACDGDFASGADHELSRLTMLPRYVALPLAV